MSISHVSMLSSYDRHLMGSAFNSSSRDKGDYIIDVDDLYQEIFQANKQAFQDLSLCCDREVDPWEKVCKEACECLIDSLNPSLEVEMKYFAGEDDEEEDHYFLVVSYEDMKFLVDPTYLQFLPLEDRGNASEIMICPINNEEDLADYLTDHGIDPEYHKMWLDPVFKEDY
ncbi:MAG: hypothetical protein HYR97_04715 [Candidatus Melainabacteria bacterium]|nr:hypothetical protein [Candidatus Melainabacteria bacterium]MBI3308662.1 hypothetical protein [Candidatus Melainabacteria bacterium]